MSAGKKLCDMKTGKWCITMWLTDGRTLDTLNELVALMPQNWRLEGQIEQGHSTDDKLHAQLFLITEQTRGTKVAKYFPHCYIDEAKNPFALKNYVHKEDTRVAEFKTIENRSPQWFQVCDKMFDWYIQEYSEELFFGIDDDEKLRRWDRFIGISLEEGMRVDIIGVNPQYRSCILRYWTNYMRLAIRRQTDRQTKKLSAEGGSEK